MSPLAHSKGEGMNDAFGRYWGRNRRHRACVGASSLRGQVHRTDYTLRGWVGLLINRDPLFSVHNALNGDFVIYLEERDANLDVVEDILAAVPLVQLKGIQSLILHDLKSIDLARLMDKARSAVPDLAIKLASVSESEALTLAEQLITAVKYARAMRSQPLTTKLELVK
jgi:hypothetical protein